MHCASCKQPPIELFHANGREDTDKKHFDATHDDPFALCNPNTDKVVRVRAEKNNAAGIHPM